MFNSVFKSGLSPIKFVLFFCLLLALPVKAALDTPWQPFDASNGFIQFQVSINGQSLTAILDTGANVHALHKKWFNHFEHIRSKRKTKLMGMYGSAVTDRLDDFSIGIFAKEYLVKDAVVFEHDSIDLILGLPYIAKHQLQVDYIENKFRLLPANTLPLKSVANLNIKVDKIGLILIETEFNRHLKTWLTLDTGNNSGLVMPWQSMQKKGWLKQYLVEQNASSSSGAINQQVQKTQLALPRFRVGPYEMNDVTIFVPDEANSANLYRRSRAEENHQKDPNLAPQGALGYAILSNFVLSIDYQAELAHIFLH